MEFNSIQTQTDASQLVSPQDELLLWTSTLRNLPRRIESQATTFQAQCGATLNSGWIGSFAYKLHPKKWKKKSWWDYWWHQERITLFSFDERESLKFLLLKYSARMNMNHSLCILNQVQFGIFHFKKVQFKKINKSQKIWRKSQRK